MPVNLRNLDRSRLDVDSLIVALASAQVIRVIWPNGGAEILKGRRTLQRVARGRQNVKLRVLELEIANTSQAELLQAALLTIRRRGPGINTDHFGHMLVTASTIPAGDDDTERFQRALKNSLH